MLVLYNILYIVFAICYLPVLLVRGKWHRGMLMRLGILPPEVMAVVKDKKVIWLHTVSVGEAQAAATLAGGLKERYPGQLLLISTVTKTGNKIAQKILGAQGLVIYSPLDIGFIVKKVIKLINPRLFIIAETEIWPNIVLNLAQKNIPVVLVNGRISLRSFRGYRIIRIFLKNILKKFSLLCMQTKDDAQRLIRLGAEDSKVKVTGNMKFDIENVKCKMQNARLKLSTDEKLFIAGSTHRGEEKIILQVYKELIKSHPELRLLIAPRHIERTEEVEKLVGKFGFQSQRFSKINLNEPRTTNHEPRTIILDTIGQLKDLYALADIVFIGGSLVAHGGQNPIEPAILSKPVLFGPYMSNFSNVAETFLDREAAIKVKDAHQLKDSCLKLLDEPGLGKKLGERAQALVQENRGASLRNIALIRSLEGVD